MGVINDAAPDPVVTDTTPIRVPNPIPTPAAPRPEILRCAYAELIVSDLQAARAFYVDALGLVITYEDDEAIYLRAYEEFIHHNLVLRPGPTPRPARFRVPRQNPRRRRQSRSVFHRTRLPSRTTQKRIRPRYRRCSTRQ
ncbi:3,4-dihydroxyphenylacetate 2,3-dioxygenase [Dermatophilus congolensis]|uniref:3,4-dihydroxyphenylacetate 2,3-dioxygenase n=1 Tax=Dermatophilus congolensis TaxID=1863 RepID=A0A239VJZ1_9MICO|nr:3,4-dihydroxyphenylacetate 2,3-dioxygenase [Dermatophilus congolensis]